MEQGEKIYNGEKNWGGVMAGIRVRRRGWGYCGDKGEENGVGLWWG